MQITLSRIFSLSNVLFFLSIGIFSIGWSQEDDTLGVKLFTQDDLDTEKFKEVKFSSTNRLAENPEYLAQEIIIIDGDEIRKFGYSTLVDVLKSIPGFRTSQPGNAIEGETFLMRGLNGNDYTKILINGIPIKPEAVKSMPIAAQLPIRHAEFIEIVMGPSSSAYGSDAMAGVINIVFPEVDRPVFAWADVNLLYPNSSEINLTLGGKTGKGKNIVNYELFASSQKASDVNLLIPEDSIRVTDENTINSPLFFNEPDDPGLPELDNMKRESRLIGTHIKYKWFEIDAINMFREEHSGFGSNPLKSSYHDPSLTFGETINSFSFKYNDINKEKRYQSRAAISALTYRTLTNSAYYAATDSISNGRNHVYARSLGFRGEYQGTIKFNEQLKVVVGTTGEYNTSHPFTSYLDRPFKPKNNSFELNAEDQILTTSAIQTPYIDSISLLDSTVWIEKYTTYNVAAFSQFLYKSKSGKFNLELGARIDYNGNDGAVFTPKLGFVYKPIPSLKIAGYYGKGHRAPRSFYLYNNYRESLLLVNNEGEGLKRSKDTLSSEKLQGGEIRTSWDVNENWNISIRYYVHAMKNRVMRQIFLGPPPGVAILPEMQKSYGYSNEESISLLQAAMISSRFKKKIGRLETDFMLSYEFADGYEQVEAGPNSKETSSEYRFVPEHSIKANVTLSLFDFTLSIRNNVIGHYVTEIFVKNNETNYEETDAFFYNMDVLLHYRLFRQVSVFGGVYNMFNLVQSGIPNASFSNAWTYNPQYGRTFKFGLNFQLN